MTLGVHMSNDVTLAEKCNFLNLITSMKEVLRIWGSRGLTLAGRIQIFKSIALSKMYISTMLHPSKQTLDQLNLIQKDFIWRGRRPKIKHSTLIGDYTNGGYEHVDVESKFELLKIIWIRGLLDSSFHSWKAIPQCLLSEVGIQPIFHSNFKLSEIWQWKIASYPKSYQGLISFWENACIKEPSNLRKIPSQTVWNNCYILKQGSTLFYPQLCYKGIQYVRDFLDDHGKIMKHAARSKFDLHDKDFMAWMSLIKSISQLTGRGKLKLLRKILFQLTMLMHSQL